MIDLNEWSDYQSSHNAITKKVADDYVNKIKANKSINLAREMTRILAPDFILVAEDKSAINSYFSELKRIEDFTWPINA